MSNSSDATPLWDTQAARNLYNIHRWGANYFDINDAGHVIAKPLQDAGTAVDLNDVIEEAKSRGLKFPVLIRFQDILRHRVESINLAFRNSITEFNYQGKYRGVFPIKVNQLREVVEEILDAGKPFDFGLEVGSKPELFAGLAADMQRIEDDDDFSRDANLGDQCRDVEEGQRNKDDTKLEEPRPEECVFVVAHAEHLERPEIPDGETASQEEIDPGNGRPRILQQDEKREREVQERARQRDKFGEFHPMACIAA